jgi:hypothetical protein
MPRKKLLPSEIETFQLSVRIPNDVMEIIRDRAAEHRRALNQEIVALLLEALGLPQKERSRVAPEKPD